MIKLPKEVSKIVNVLEERGITAYCAGNCVRQAMTGEEPLDWDILAITDFDSIRGLFEGAHVLDENRGILRFDYVQAAIAALEEETSEETGDTTDNARAAMEMATRNGLIIDLRAVTEVESFLAEADFTVNALADSTSHGFVDPYGGKNDITKKLIRTVADSNKVFCEKPYLMFAAISMVSELGYDLAGTTYEAIMANQEALKNVSVGRIREEFFSIMGGEYAGKALKMLVGCGMMPYILGPNVNNLHGREARDMEEMAENLEKTLNVAERRIGLFYLCLNRNRALKAVEYMNYEDGFRQNLMDAINHMQDLYFITDGPQLMDFLARYGLERYTYMHNLAKAQVIVYDAPDNRVQSRVYMYKEIISMKYPVYIEDLAVTGQDLVDAGIVPDDPDKINDMLLMLTDVIHRDYKLNTYKKLMEKAKYFKKNKVAALLRNVKWLK